MYGFYLFLKTSNSCEALPYRKVVEFRPELASRTDWWPKRCPIIANILFILCISGIVPTYGTAHMSTKYDSCCIGNQCSSPLIEYLIQYKTTNVQNIFRFEFTWDIKNMMLYVTSIHSILFQIANMNLLRKSIFEFPAADLWDVYVF